MTDHSEIRKRVASLRNKLAELNLDGFVVPRADVHQGEEVSASEERLTFISGFTGSAGSAVVLQDRASLFVDGRYTLQAKLQTPADCFEQVDLVETPPTAWLKSVVEQGTKIAFDPWLHTKAQVDSFKTACSDKGAELLAVDGNPIDQVWDEQPAKIATSVFVHPVERAGLESLRKIELITEVLEENSADLVVLSLPDSIAWLLNVRASDLRSTPVALSFVVVKKDGVLMWFIDEHRLSDEVKKHLPDSLTVCDPDNFETVLSSQNSVWQLDATSAPFQLFNLAEQNGNEVITAPDPVIALKAVKNSVELGGMRAAHDRDGVAVSRFVKWLSEEALGRASSNDPVTELTAIQKLLEFRDEVKGFHSTSFDTICGSGSNGAIVHYRASEESNRSIQEGDLVLVDSGGQYLDGTTDITRVVVIGEPSADMKKHYTLVLKGHLALHAAVFPKGTSGQEIDCLARQYLWQEGLDYDHGTGHGVGAFLSVHEGPARIAKARGPLVALTPGMVLSNEPGYYKAGEYGIRIENLEIVTARPDLGNDAREMMGFETLTFVPYEKRLIDVALLTSTEIKAIDLYHQEVWGKVSPGLSGGDLEWLKDQTQPLNKN
jgi:Xaa-Pro aminopeptidase